MQRSSLGPSLKRVLSPVCPVSNIKGWRMFTHCQYFTSSKVKDQTFCLCFSRIFVSMDACVNPLYIYGGTQHLSSSLCLSKSVWLLHNEKERSKIKWKSQFLRYYSQSFKWNCSELLSEHLSGVKVKNQKNMQHSGVCVCVGGCQAVHPGDVSPGRSQLGVSLPSLVATALTSFCCCFLHF